MTKEELLKKDLLLVNASLSIKNAAYLRTIIEMQIYIISKLTNSEQSEVTIKVNDDIKENFKIVNEAIEKSIEDVSIIYKWN